MTFLDLILFVAIAISVWIYSAFHQACSQSKTMWGGFAWTAVVFGMMWLGSGIGESSDMGAGVGGLLGVIAAYTLMYMASPK